MQDTVGQHDTAGQRAEAGLAGRRAQAARNDETILEAARAVFLADPKAPISAVADRAGVGISALYRRYQGKDALLRRLCHDGLRQFIAEAEAALGQPDSWLGLSQFLRRVVDADVHSLTVHLAGMFVPTADMHADAQRAAALAGTLVDRARASGQLRPEVVAGDVTLLLEGCAAVRVPADPDRTRQLRQRYLTLLLDGMRADARPRGERLPGPPPQPAELNWRWQD